MSRRHRADALLGAELARAPLFSALGDETRLQLLGRLSLGQPRSISELAEESNLTRQAITKHLHILERVGLVHGARNGRETRFAFKPEPIDDALRFLKLVSDRWDKALARLKAFVESNP
jgi:DNA-binding transcriptional ArsR family regulator